MPGLRLRIRRYRRRLMFFVARAVMRIAGFARARTIGAWLGSLHHALTPGERKRLRRDMAHALGRLEGDAQVAAQLHEAYRVNTRAVLEILAMFDRPQDEHLLAACCQIEGRGHLHTALAGGRGAILLPGHSGNGAMLAVRLALLGVPVSVVYKQARMMSADFFAQGFPLYGIEGILANEGIKAYAKMLSALKRNRVLFVMMDQGVRLPSDGLPTRFLGKEVPMPAGPAQLARHARAPVLPVATLAADPAWRFEIQPPLVLAAGSTLEADFEAQVRATERNILAHPELWSWPHRRWRRLPPSSRPQRRKLWRDDPPRS